MRDAARQPGADAADDEPDEDEPDEDDLDCAAGRYKSFGERCALSGCGFEDNDEGCLGGF